MKLVDILHDNYDLDGVDWHEKEIKIDVNGDLLDIEKVIKEGNEIVFIIPASSLEKRLF